MITVYSEKHRLHQGKAELIYGQLVPPFENPTRLDYIVQRLQQVRLGELVEPHEFGLEPILRVHSQAYLQFLQNAHDDWKKEHGDTDALPLVWPNRGLRQIEPASIQGRLGYYSFDAGTPIMAGTFEAAVTATAVALTGVELITKGQKAAFSLCRPPGHHADAEHLGGYCFLNNAAIAAQAFRDKGAERVAILDVDYHHGNGTQAIFYDRAEVFFVSLHGHPSQEYPYFLGYEDETGVGAGEGYTLNLPLPLGTAWYDYRLALESALEQIRRYRPEVLIVSLGVDTFAKDPISQFKLTSPDFLELGRQLASLALPTLFVMEGGYAIEEIGVNTVNVLTGFEAHGQ
jgi:acetoin utilization deacetylase AcuC-like enzyme